MIGVGWPSAIHFRSSVFPLSTVLSLEIPLTTGFRQVCLSVKSLSLDASLKLRMFCTRLSGSWHSILTSLRETFSPSAKTNSRNSTLLASVSQLPSSFKAQSQRNWLPDSFKVDRLKEINFWNQWYLKYWSLFPLKSSFSSLSLPSKACGWIQARLLFEKLISL